MSGDKATQNRFVFLDVLRGVAPVLVIYSHVVALFLDPNEIDTDVVDLLNEQARDPLRLEQHMGHLAVVLFFLVSGFIITQVGTQESHREFAIKRLFRVYPLLIFTVGLTAVLSIFNMEVLRTGQHFEITLQSVLTNFTLANYLMVPQIILVGVAWTLVIEIIFYLIVLSLLAVLRRWTWLAILIELTLVLSTMLLAREFGPNFFLLAINLSFLPVVLLGQVTWAVWSGRIPLWLGTLFGFACWILYVLADIRNMGRLDEAYSSTFALGFAIFIAVLLAEQRLRPNKYVSYCADRSYSLYLLHGPLAFPVMERLNGVVPLPLVILAGLALTVGATELTFRYIEQPGQRIGRKLSKRFRLKEIAARKAPPEPEYEDDDYYEDDYYEPESVHAAPIGSRRIVVTGDLWDSPQEPQPYPPPRQPQYGWPQHDEPRQREARYGWPQADEPNGDHERHSRQNGESQHRWPESSQPLRGETPNGRAHQRNGELRQHEPQNGRPQHREPHNDEPRLGWPHDEPQNGRPQHREPSDSPPPRGETPNGAAHRPQHNGELRHHEPQSNEPPHHEPRNGGSHRPQRNGELPQHEPQNGQPQHRRPPNSPPPHRSEHNDELRQHEPQNGRPLHREPPDSPPPRGETRNGRAHRAQHNSELRQHEPQNGQPQHREPPDSPPPRGETPNGATHRAQHNSELPQHQPQNGRSQHREPQSNQPPQHEPQHRWPQADEPRHREPMRREPRNGQSHHGWPEAAEPKHHGRRNGEPSYRQPAHWEPPDREPQRGESPRGEAGHGTPRHRQPVGQEPPPYPPVRRSPERAHRYRDE